jgi:hypothetical protein
MNLAGFWIHPVDIFGIVMVGEAGTALVAQLVAQKEAKALPALIPPVIVDVELRVLGRAKTRQAIGEYR